MVFSMVIELKKHSKVYHPGDDVTGRVCIKNDGSGDLKHDGITLVMEGCLTIQFPSKATGLIDSFVSSPKPVQLCFDSLDVCKGGKFAPGVSFIPFQIPLPKSTDKRTIYETFHGSCITIQYCLRATMKRSLLAKPLASGIEFVVENKPNPEVKLGKPLPFSLTPDIVANVADKSRLPQFVIRGHIDSSDWSLCEPITGEVCIEQCRGGAVSGIELQLHRLEVCGHPGDATAPSQVSEVQGWQICDGNISPHLPIPFYLLQPRTFTCISTATSTFSIGFQLSIVVNFSSDYQVRKSFPIIFTR